MRLLPAILFLVPAFAAEDFVIFKDPRTSPPEQLKRYLNSIAFQQLDQRARTVATIRRRQLFREPP
jgi:hypothetical protein